MKIKKNPENQLFYRNSVKLQHNLNFGRMLAQKIIVSGKETLNQSKMSAIRSEEKTANQNQTLNETMPPEGEWKSPTFQPAITTSTPKLEPEVQQAQPQDCSWVQPPLGKTSTRMICPYCESDIWTRVESKPSLWAWIAGIALVCVG